MTQTGRTKVLREKPCVGATACFCCVVDMGHRGTGTISVSGGGVLPRCGLLRTGL